MHDGREMCGYLLDYTQPYHNLLGVETEKYLWDTESVNVIGKDAVRYSLADELGTPLRYCDAEGHTTGYSIFQEYGM